MAPNPTATSLVEAPTAQGPVRGALEPHLTAVACFKGVPFAAPPVGPLRWAPPQPLAGRTGALDCLAFGPACPQGETKGPFGEEIGSSGEDCLYLNIWTPADFKGAGLPVMVWIHGGGFVIGQGARSLYHGAPLAARGAVVVTINYRLGPFGFLAHPWLSAESPQGVSGNYGLLDQIAALAWVRENIHAFGGDPERVTIFGESTGARSVMFLMAAAPARGLFQRAIVQSGSLFRPLPRLREPTPGNLAMEEYGLRLSRALGAASLDEMRQLPAERVLGALPVAATELLTAPGEPLPGKNGIPYSPVLDGHVLTQDPLYQQKNGLLAPVPVIIGANRDEARLFLAQADLTGLTPQAFLARHFPDCAGEALALWPAQDQSMADWLNGFLTQSVWTWAARATARDLDAAGNPAWLYEFTQARSGWLAALGAAHGSEIRYAFDNLDQGQTPPTDEDRRTARLMSSYWLNFAATGDPNGQGAPHWPAHDGRDLVQVIGPEPGAIPHPHAARCDFLARVDQARGKRGF